MSAYFNSVGWIFGSFIFALLGIGTIGGFITYPPPLTGFASGMTQVQIGTAFCTVSFFFSLLSFFHSFSYLKRHEVMPERRQRFYAVGLLVFSVLGLLSFFSLAKHELGAIFVVATFVCMYALYSSSVDLVAKYALGGLKQPQVDVKHTYAYAKKDVSFVSWRAIWIIVLATAIFANMDWVQEKSVPFIQENKVVQDQDSNLLFYAGVLTVGVLFFGLLFQYRRKAKPLQAKPLPIKGTLIEKGIYAYDVDIEWVKQYYVGSGGQDTLQQGKEFTFLCPSPECDQPIDMSLPWVCPRASCRNVNNGKNHSIFETCKGCGMVPRAYQCYECGFIFGLAHNVKWDELKKYAYRENMWRPEKFPSLKPAPVQPVPEPVKAPELPFITHGIPAAKRFEHCTIIARSGWGKTRLMQALAYHDIQRHDSTVVLDSEGLFSDNILHLRDKGDLIYIDFTDPVNIPCLSIFDVEFPDDPKEEDRVFGSVIELYGYIFESLMGATSTPRQIAFLQFLSELMLKINGASLRTMKDVIFDDRPFQKDIKKLRPDAQEWFANRWPTKEWGEVKRQVMDRFDTIFADRILTRVFTQGTSKIDLFNAINLGKVIVVNVNSGHLREENCSILGRLFIAMFMQAALRRKEGDPKNKPTFLYIDEAWRYFGGKEEKLSKMYRMIRKFNVGLVVASQQISHFTEVSMSLRNAAFQSGILFGGYLSDKEDREMVKELSLPKEASTKTLQKVEKVSSEFYCSIDGKTKKVVIPLDVMEKAPRLTDNEVTRLIQDNNDRYCEKVRRRERQAGAASREDETVLEPDERGVLRPKELPKIDRGDEFWQ